MEGRRESNRMHEVPVDWEALEDAFENNAPEVHSYLHLNSGEVLRVVDGIADPEMHSRIAADNTYMRIESVSSREQYRWMERFIQMVENAPLRGALTQAIDGKGAFRRFKDVLMSHSHERERWFAFRSERLRVFMEAWLSAHSISPVQRPELVVTPEASDPEATSALADGKQAPTARRARNAESLRRQVREVCEGLNLRDLDKVLAFAEFVSARRAARSGSRTDNSAVDHPVPEGLGDLEADSSAPSSESRKMTVIK